MKSLPPIVHDGCMLTPDGLAAQAGRAARLTPSIVKVRRADDELRVFFGPGVDRALVREMVETEQSCCSFLRVEYDDAERLLRFGSEDEQGREIVGQLAGFFGEGR
jgi:hypothetical protein